MQYSVIQIEQAAKVVYNIERRAEAGLDALKEALEVLVAANSACWQFDVRTGDVLVAGRAKEVQFVFEVDGGEFTIPAETRCQAWLNAVGFMFEQGKAIGFMAFNRLHLLQIDGCAVQESAPVIQTLGEMEAANPMVFANKD